MTVEQREERSHRWIRGLVIAGFAWIAFGIAVLGWAVETQAQPFDPKTEALYQSALQHWGVAAPPLCTEVTRELIPRANLYPAVGRATMTETDPTPCDLELAEGLRPCYAYGVLLHEVGHLLGYAHNSDPRSIMYAGEEPSPSKWYCFSSRERRLQAGIRRISRRCHRLAGERRRGCRETLEQKRFQLHTERELVGPEPTLLS